MWYECDGNVIWFVVNIASYCVGLVLSDWKTGNWSHVTLLTVEPPDLNLWIQLIQWPKGSIKRLNLTWARTRGPIVLLVMRMYGLTELSWCLMPTQGHLLWKASCGACYTLWYASTFLIKHKSHSRQGKSSIFNHIKPSKIEGRLKIWGELEELRVAMDSSNKSNGDQPVTQEELQRVVLTVAYALFNPSALA